MINTETTRAKLRVQIGHLRFAGEGDPDWLTERMSAFLETATKDNLANQERAPTLESGTSPRETATPEPLPAFMRKTGSETKQVRRFLATAAWLQRREISPLTSSLVAKSLRDSQQRRLGNPSDCLNQNVGKGYCEKTPDGFFVTEHGFHALGL